MNAVPAPRQQPLRRDVEHGIVAGVCSGIGRYFKVDPVLIRVAFAAATVLTWGVAILAYPLMWFFMPEEDGPTPTQSFPAA